MNYPVLCIKSLYAKRIKKGIKKWEFRTYKISQYNIIYLYQPKNKAITTKIYVNQIIKDSPENIWQLCKDEAGITKKEFFNYFNNKKRCYAYRIDKYEKVYKKIKDYPKQVLIYMNEEELK